MLKAKTWTLWTLWTAWTLWLAALALPARELTLAWDASSEVISNQWPVISYRIFAGPASRFYTNVIDAGVCTEFTITNAAAGPQYYSVVAVGSDGRESVPSNEVCDCPSFAVVMALEGSVDLVTWTNLASWTNAALSPAQPQRFYRARMEVR